MFNLRKTIEGLQPIARASLFYTHYLSEWFFVVFVVAAVQRLNVILDFS